MTRKQTYLRLLSARPTQWLESSARNPSRHMTAVHVALHRIELRRRNRIASYYANVAGEEGWQ
jgi:hypothetical protein